MLSQCHCMASWLSPVSTDSSPLIIAPRTRDPSKVTCNWTNQWCFLTWCNINRFDVRRIHLSFKAAKWTLAATLWRQHRITYTRQPRLCSLEIRTSKICSQRINSSPTLLWYNNCLPMCRSRFFWWLITISHCCRDCHEVENHPSSIEGPRSNLDVKLRL